MRVLDRLTEMQVRKAKPDKGKTIKRLLDGGGLYLQASVSKAGGVNRNWMFRYQLDGSRDPETGRVSGRHDIGLGPLHTISLAEARQMALDLRKQVLAGNDPLEMRNDERADRKAAAQARRAEEAKAQTFRECVDKYLSVHGDKWKNRKHAAQWRATLETYAYPVIGDLSVADIDEAHLVRVLQPIWRKVPETARRVRARVEAVLGFATVSKFRSGDNPARWKNHLQTLLGGTQNAVEHHAALPFIDAPAFMAELRGRKSTSASALEFAILTAGRTGEVIGARWSEIDLKHKTWTIPKERMKAKREHRVPLSPRAVEILKRLERRGDFVFGSAVTGKPLSNMALLELLRGIRPGQTVHGFRSAFRDWAAERTAFPREVAEMALAHTIPDKVEAAYRRGDLFEKRCKLMEAWASFLAKPVSAEGGKIVQIAAAARAKR
jgi:integrase